MLPCGSQIIHTAANNLRDDSIFQMQSRAYYALSIPVIAGESALLTIAGVGGMLASLATAGTKQKPWQWATSYLGTLQLLPSNLLMSLLKMINPKAKLDRSEENPYPVISSGNGVVTECLYRNLETITEKARNSNNPLIRHVALRIIYLVSLPFILISRCFDLAIGLVLTVFMLITGGAYQSLNSHALAGLQITGIVTDLFLSLVKFLNPWAGKFPSADEQSFLSIATWINQLISDGKIAAENLRDFVQKESDAIALINQITLRDPLTILPDFKAARPDNNAILLDIKALLRTKFSKLGYYDLAQHSLIQSI